MGRAGREDLCSRCCCMKARPAGVQVILSMLQFLVSTMEKKKYNFPSLLQKPTYETFQSIQACFNFVKLCLHVIKLSFNILVLAYQQQNQYMIESRLSERSGDTNNPLPQRQQWALITQQRALEYQRAKSMQKLLSQQKKDTFKRQLDQQLELRHNLRKDQKEQDKKYYEYIVHKAQQMKEREEKEKFQKFIMSKQIQEDNKKKFQSYSNPKFEDYGKIYNIDIGRKSQEEKKQRAEAIRQDVIRTLDMQRQLKDARLKAQKQQDIVETEKNQYYRSLIDQRNSRDKKYEQNQQVYNYYRDLYQQKMRKDRELQHKFVDQVQQRQSEEALRRKENEISQKQRRNLQMRDTLEQQLQLLHHRKQEENRVNPEQATYSFINNIFQSKRPTFDKQEYSKILERQAEEQRLNRLKQDKYMSEEEYRYNSNQLSKAINGNYAHDRYFDRSIMTVGDRLNLSSIDPLHTEDADLIKNKLQVARSHHKLRRMDQSAIELGPII